MVARDGRAAGEWVKDLADGFNKSQTEYQVNAIYKGNYTEVMTGAIAAFRAKQQLLTSSRSSRSERRR